MPVPKLIDFDEDGGPVPSSPTVDGEDIMAESWDDISQVRPNATRHPEYYFDTGDVVFLVRCLASINMVGLRAEVITGRESLL